MIVIDGVELSKSTVNVGEALLLKVTAHEEIATWQDVKIKTWDNIQTKTWEDVKLKIF